MITWIDVNDRFPSNYEPVLMFMTNKNNPHKKKSDSLIEEIQIGRYCFCSGWRKEIPHIPYELYDSNGKEINYYKLQRISGLIDVTYWMPLPDYPDLYK